MMPVRRELTSKLPNSGCSSSAMNMVGTPCTAVHFSFSIVCRTLRGSKISTGTMVEAWVTQTMTPRTQPKQWKKGTGMQRRSFSVNFMHSPMLKPLLTML